MAFLERFRGVPKVEKERRERIAINLGTIYFCMSGREAKKGEYTTDSLPGFIRTSAEEGNKIATRILAAAPDLGTAERVKLLFDNTFSTREMSFTVATGQNTMCFCYDKKTFKIKNPGQFGMPDNPEVVLDDLAVFIAEDLVKKPISG